MTNLWPSVARVTITGRPFDAEEAKSPTEALRAMTINATHASKRGVEEGSIEIGKRTNFVALEGDPVQCSVDDMPNITAEQIFIDGTLAYDRQARSR